MTTDIYNSVADAMSPQGDKKAAINGGFLRVSVSLEVTGTYQRLGYGALA